jgi:hypothetical protein
MPRTQASTMATLDVSRLTDGQLRNAVRIFDEMKRERLLPFNEAAHDDNRKSLDRRVITEVLGLDASISSALDLLRDKLCSEPSIHGGKRSARSAPGVAKLQTSHS